MVTVSAANICPVLTEDIYPASKEDGTAAGPAAGWQLLPPLLRQDRCFVLKHNWCRLWRLHSGQISTQNLGEVVPP